MNRRFLRLRFGAAHRVWEQDYWLEWLYVYNL